MKKGLVNVSASDLLLVRKLKLYVVNVALNEIIFFWEHMHNATQYKSGHQTLAKTEMSNSIF